MPVLLARPRGRRVQGDAVHPRGHGRFAAERIHRAPDLNDDFLKEILAICMLERIGVDHLEEDPFVVRQPLVEDAFPIAVVHDASLPLLVAPGESFLTPQDIGVDGAGCFSVPRAESRRAAGPRTARRTFRFEMIARSCRSDRPTPDGPARASASSRAASHRPCRGCGRPCPRRN